LKDIENSKLVHVQDALGRLDRALARLESAAVNAGDPKASAAESAALKSKLENLTRAHGTLQDAAERVATRLDTAIGRLSASIQD